MCFGGVEFRGHHCGHGMMAHRHHHLSSRAFWNSFGGSLLGNFIGGGIFSLGANLFSRIMPNIGGGLFSQGYANGAINGYGVGYNNGFLDGSIFGRFW